MAIDLDRIIRSSRTPKEAFDNAVMQSGNLTESQKTNLAQRILNSSKYRGNYSGGGTSFTGGGTGSGGGGGGNIPTGGGGFWDSLGNGIKKLTGFVDGTVKFGAKIGGEAYKTQMGKEGDETLLNVAQTLSTQGMKGLLSLTGDAAGAVLDQLKQESVLLSDVNTKIGISGQLSQGLRDDMISAQSEARRYGFELAQIGEFYTTLATQSGKFSLINKQTIDQAAPVAAALGMTLSELAESIGEYEKVGLGAKETTKAIGDAATRSVSLGLNARKVADEMKTSIGKLNEYGFRNGVEGLEKMVQKSVEFKLSMDKVATVADKVLNPEGAIDLAANLQVLGGAIGDFGDPIKMMYDATNNMEGLQDSIIGAAKGLATYNKEQGRFEITGINLRRGKEMAGQLGMTMEELSKTAIAAQERVSASTALMSTGLQMDTKDKEFLTNLSRMQDGEMKIVVPESLQDKLGKQSEITLSKLTEDQKKVLLENKKAFEKMNPADMAKAQLTETQKMVRDVEVMASWAKIQAAHFLKGGAEKAIGDEMKLLRDRIAGINPKTNIKGAEAAGADAADAFKKMTLTDSSTWMNAGKKLVDGLSTTFNPNQQPQAQQPVVQEVKQTVNFTSDVNSDWISRVAQKDSAFGFEFKNSKGYDVLTPAKRKGK